ncbi:hypothetical protein [Archangium lansingense]|uniref:Guanylate cyclase domain-containing protein n=1 Tax=Archangium lansingense TaxID=2995310 RepID=A0ABT4A443_9BACT|nr:hypothetical protein [Archangium lansinium]MCY1075759.1 hypothetical protein [Archangium lansinium]
MSLLLGLGLAVLSAVLLMTVRLPALELAWLLLVVVPIVFLVMEASLALGRLPRLDGEERELTAFFSDIRGFSSFSETFQDKPRELVRVLNRSTSRSERNR